MHDDYWFDLMLWVISAICFFCLFKILTEMI